MDKVQDKDKGWKKIAENLHGELIARIGVQDDDSPRIEGEVTNLDLAMIHEFGAANGIPSRSFIRSSFDDHREEYGRLLEKGAKLILSGKRTIEQIVAVLGERCLSDIKMRINSNIPPPLLPATIKRKTVGGKEGNVALIDTAQMKNSLTVKLGDYPDGV